jgi:hypothetical protein
MSLYVFPFIAALWVVSSLRRLARKRTLSGICLPFLAGLGWTMIYGDDFIWGSCILCIVAVWGVAFWLESPALAKKRPRRPRPGKLKSQEKIIIYNRLVRRFNAWKWGGVATICVLLGISIIVVNNKREAKELKSLAGLLIPANDPAPQSSCTSDIPPGALALYLGNSVAYVTSFPHTVIMIRGQKRLVIDRDKANRIAVTVDIFGADDRVIASIEKNKFRVNQNNYLEMERKDRSSLRVVDQYKNEVLNIRYLNPSAIKLKAILRYPGYKTIDITDKEQYYGNETQSGICMGESINADIYLR